MTDIEIAQAAELENIKDVAAKLDITEDDLEKALKKIQERTDNAIAKIDKLISAKEAELMEI